MYRQYLLPSFPEHNFFCFPHSVGTYTKPIDHNVFRESGVRDFSLHLVTCGKGYIECNGTLFTLKRGDMFLHTPYQRMRYYTTEEDRWDICWLQFNGLRLETYLMECGFHTSSVWFIEDVDSMEQAYLKLLEEVGENEFARPFIISALTYSILVEFICNAIPFTSKKWAINGSRISQLLPLMQERAHLPFVLEEWAERVNLTPNYFCNLFKKVTKVTPLTYITKCRILRSKQMLMNPHMQIKEIAINCGYPSISYFNKIFMQMESITPGEFRKSHF